MRLQSEAFVVTVKPEHVQFVVLKLLFCCKAQPVDGYGQETVAPLPDFVTASLGGRAARIVAWAVQIPTPATTAASLVPSAEQAMHCQFAVGALV